MAATLTGVGWLWRAQLVQERHASVTAEWLESIVLAVNEEYIEPGEKVDLKAGDEVAFIPPISGG